MFTVGSKVVHPTCGAGVIVRIQEKSLGDLTTKYYVIETASRGRQLFVPVDRGEAIGLHPVANKSRLKDLLEEPFEEPRKGDIAADYKVRQEEMRERLKSGSFREVLSVVRTLYYINGLRPLGTVDRGLLDLGKELLASEYALAAEIDIHSGMRTVEDSLAAGPVAGG
jgi:RNA polymerase-interacting CarD/CdnL/TRCF family regulator